MMDVNTKRIKVEDLEAPVFKALLHFIYWDSLPDLQELTGLETKWASTLMFQHLLAAADRYGLDRPRLLFEASLCQDVAINSVATTLALTDGYEYLKESCPSVLTKLLEYIARVGEQSVFLLTHCGEGTLDGSDVHSQRIKQRL